MNIDADSFKSYIPIITLAAALIAAFVTLQSDVKAAEQRISELAQNNAKLTEIQGQLRRQEAVRSEVLRQFKENQTDIKKLLGDLSKQIRAISR